MPLPSTSTRVRIGSIALAASLLAAACGSASGDTRAQSAQEPIVASAGNEVTLDNEAVELASSTTALFDSSVVHDIEIAFDQAAYDEMIVTYETTGEKDWIEATVTIDGTTLENVGIRLKGNSSLFSLTTDTAGNPEDLPWLISLDKYVDGQNYQDYTDLVIRSNSTETAMNEAVALELLGLAGLATEEAIATSLTVNGGETELRLAIEHPDEAWEEANFDGDDAALYKADSEGDYSYRGDDPDAYDDVFNQKVGEDDLEPLVEFLDFLNNSDDATFAADLGEWLDIESFATNLAFGTANVGGGGGFGGGADRPALPTGSAGAGEAGPGAGGSNVLSSRFLANDSFAAMYEQATTELTESLFSSGAADAIVDEWVDVLSSSAVDLIGVATVESDAAAIIAMFPTS